MKILLNDRDCEVPTDLSQITIRQFLDYQDWKGRELDVQLKEILDREYDDEFLREIDLSAHEDREALSWVSFFSGLDLTDLAHEKAMPLLVIYRQMKLLLIQSEEEAYTGPAEVEWREQVWEIKDYRVTPTSDFIVNELVTSKEVMRQIYSIGKGKWDALPYLCAVFFRLRGEPFTDALITDGSPRLSMMYDLPMDIAVRVAFFLTVSVNIWSSRLVFSDPAEEPLPPSFDTTNAGDGSISSPPLQKQKSLTSPAPDAIPSNVPRWQIFTRFFFGRRKKETSV